MHIKKLILSLLLITSFYGQIKTQEKLSNKKLQNTLLKNLQSLLRLTTVPLGLIAHILISSSTLDEKQKKAASLVFLLINCFLPYINGEKIQELQESKDLSKHEKLELMWITLNHFVVTCMGVYSVYDFMSPPLGAGSGYVAAFSTLFSLVNLTFFGASYNLLQQQFKFHEKIKNFAKNATSRMGNAFRGLFQSTKYYKKTNDVWKQVINL